MTASLLYSCRAVWRLVFMCSFVGAAGFSSTQEVARAFLKGPYLQAPGTNTMTVMWESPTNQPGIVHFGLKGGLVQTSRTETSRELTGVSAYTETIVSPDGNTVGKPSLATNRVFVYEITLTNLHPDSVYTYSAETGGVRTPPRRFKTFGAQSKRVTFIAYGDTRTNPDIHAVVVANFKGYSPDFILHTGDLAADGRRYDLWGREFFGPLAHVIDEVPILTVIGNHERDGSNYLRYVHLPGNERWYSYDIGPVHLLALDFHYEKEMDEQFVFARKDLLASMAPWKIIFLHYPVFNIGGHGTGWGHAAYLPLFHEAKVDLIIAGHSHIYERFRPVAAADGPSAWPITHITTGGGGAPLYPAYPHPALVVEAMTNHFLVIEATPKKLSARAFTTNDTLLDSFELKKRNGLPPAKYLAQVYPEDTLKLAQEVAGYLTGNLASTPTMDSPAPVMFDIRPMKTATIPVALEISVAPISAPFYKMEGGPLRTLTPTATNLNSTVWARVRATGKRTIAVSGRSHELSPLLIFQARVFGKNTETLAYGQASVVSNAAAEAAETLPANQRSQ